MAISSDDYTVYDHVIILSCAHMVVRSHATRWNNNVRRFRNQFRAYSAQFPPKVSCVVHRNMISHLRKVVGSGFQKGFLDVGFTRSDGCKDRFAIRAKNLSRVSGGSGALPWKPFPSFWYGTWPSFAFWCFYMSFACSVFIFLLMSGFAWIC